MILNRTGAEFEYEGVTYTIGGAIVGTAESEYAGLYGRINAIHDGEDKETENETPDIYCEFDPPVMPHEVKTLEDTFSDLYHQPKTIADIVLDMVIMAPEMIRPLDDLRSMRKRVNVFLVMEDWAVDGEHGNDCEAFSDYDDAKRIMPGQKEDLLGAYAKLLASQGKTTLAAKLVPAIRFVTSDTGIASAKVSAMLEGTQHPIHIGSCIAVDHRHQSKVEDFEAALDQLFAQFGDSVARLQKLLDIHLSYPVNTMTRICKKLSLPKKAALEAIGMFEMAYGGGTATAHDVFMAMQEIPYILKSDHTPESKMLVVEENMARALTLRWGDYDLAKAVSY